VGQGPARHAQGKQQQQHGGDQRVGEPPGGWGLGTTNSRGSLQLSEATLTSFQTRVRSARILSACNEEVQSAGGLPQTSGNPNQASVQLNVSAGGPKSGGVSVRSSTQEKTEDLLVLRDLVESGEVKAVIDRRYSLEQIPEAHP
jgi:zinc-binding alcohol dehydrogenase family protein